MPYILGHRGAGPQGENSIEGIRLAAEHQASGVELDVHLHQGELVLAHDPPQAGSDLLSLARALVAADSMIVDLELKAASDVQAFVSLLAGHDLDPARHFISSFWLEMLVPAREVLDGIETGILSSAVYDPHGALALETAASRGFEIVAPEHSSISESLIAEAHRSAIAVVAWTVDEPVDIRRLAEWGVDAIVTNDIRTALQALT